MKVNANYIETLTKYNTGRGSDCDVMTLKDGRVLVMSDEFVGFYDSWDAFQYDCGDDCRAGFWIPTDRLEVTE